METKHLFSKGAFWRKCLAYVKHLLSMSWEGSYPLGILSVSGRSNGTEEKVTQVFCKSRVSPVMVAGLVALLMLFTLGIGNAWGENGSISSFTATSGNIVSGVITYSSTKVSTNGPEVVSSQLKLYRKGKSGGLGDYVTVSATSPAKITSITFTLSSSLAYSYQVDGASAITGTNNSISISSINASSVKFQNNSKSQMFVTGISLTYSTGASTKTYHYAGVAKTEDKTLIISILHCVCALCKKQPFAAMPLLIISKLHYRKTKNLLFSS